jgi:hypothetical protein
MKDDILYDEVARELQAQAMVPGVWARAFSEADGNLDGARALYIKYRVAQLAEARSQQVSADRRAAAQAAKKRASIALRRLTYLTLAILSGVITLILGMGGIISFTEHSVESIVIICVAIAFGILTCECIKAYDNAM